jgi:HKD family nuclease
MCLLNPCEVTQSYFLKAKNMTLLIHQLFDRPNQKIYTQLYEYNKKDEEYMHITILMFNNSEIRVV